MDLIDLSNCKDSIIGYDGNAPKESIVYNNENYMLKFASDDNLNGNICEYIGSKIFKDIGFDTQEVFLAKYKDKICVACKNFTNINTRLRHFMSIKNRAYDSTGNGKGTELEHILKAIDNQTHIEPERLKNYFYRMFIVDSLLANNDRHNENWGFLINLSDNSIKEAPIYDCENSLYSRISKEDMTKCLIDENERYVRIYERPVSHIYHNKYKINYFNYISSLEDKYCNNALLYIYPKINLNNYNKIIDEISCIDETQKSFYKIMLKERKEKILDFSLNKLINNNLDLKKQFEKNISRD